MFPSIDNISGLKSVKKVLENRSNKFPPGNCIIEALKLFLESNNSIFNIKHYLQSDGTAQGPHMSCSYSDIAIQYFDIKALEFNPPVTCWKRFWDDIFIVWPHTLEELQVFFNYMNNLIVCFYHVTYEFESESTLYSCLELLDACFEQGVP